jgi:hypothetical protein
MIDDILIYDDIIDIDYQNKIKDILCSLKFPWFFCNDISYTGNNVQQRPGFQHLYVEKKKINSQYHKHIAPIILKSLKKANIKNNVFLQGRSFLQLPLNISDRHIVDTPHVDADIPHLAVLYYVNDSDGDTIIYENEFKGYDNRPFKKDLKIKQKVTPKKGRVVIFDGKYWHTAEQPEHNNRCRINYNII